MECSKQDNSLVIQQACFVNTISSEALESEPHNGQIIQLDEECSQIHSEKK